MWGEFGSPEVTVSLFPDSSTTTRSSWFGKLTTEPGTLTTSSASKLAASHKPWNLSNHFLESDGEGCLGSLGGHISHLLGTEHLFKMARPLLLVQMECEGASVLQLIGNRHCHTLLAEAGHRYHPQTPGTFLLVSPRFVLPSQYLVWTPSSRLHYHCSKISWVNFLNRQLYEQRQGSHSLIPDSGIS